MRNPNIVIHAKVLQYLTNLLPTDPSRIAENIGCTTKNRS